MDSLLSRYGHFIRRYLGRFGLDIRWRHPHLRARVWNSDLRRQRHNRHSRRKWCGRSGHRKPVRFQQQHPGFAHLEQHFWSVALWDERGYDRYRRNDHCIANRFVPSMQSDECGLRHIHNLHGNALTGRPQRGHSRQPFEQQQCVGCAKLGHGRCGRYYRDFHGYRRDYFEFTKRHRYRILQRHLGDNERQSRACHVSLLVILQSKQPELELIEHLHRDLDSARSHRRRQRHPFR